MKRKVQKKEEKKGLTSGGTDSRPNISNFEARVSAIIGGVEIEVHPDILVEDQGFDVNSYNYMGVVMAGGVEP